MHAKVIDQNAALAEMNIRVVNENEALINKNIGLVAELETERNRSNQLSKEMAGLTDERDELKVSLNTANQTIKLHEEVFTEAARNHIELIPILEGIVTQPEIRARVAWADEENNIVILNVGLNDKVRKNFFFTVSRDGDFVAKVNVFALYDEYCAARIITKNTKKLAIQPGDNAWTRLY